MASISTTLSKTLPKQTSIEWMYLASSAEVARKHLVTELAAVIYTHTYL